MPVTDFPLECKRLRESKIWAMCRDKPELTRPTINLWLAAWESSPVGTLPNDDQILARAADLGLKEFQALRSDLLHGFAVNSDRVCHPVICEKASKKPSRAKRKVDEYSPAFNLFWQEYDAAKLAPGASKLMAWEAWKTALPSMPNVDCVLDCVRLYKASLKRNGRDPTSACHPATWLNQRRYEMFFEQTTSANATEAMQERAFAAWGGMGKQIAERIGVPQFLTWFAGSTLKKANGDGITRIYATTIMKRDYIEAHFSKPIRECLGEYSIEVRG